MPTDDASATATAAIYIIRYKIINPEGAIKQALTMMNVTHAFLHFILIMFRKFTHFLTLQTSLLHSNRVFHGFIARNMNSISSKIISTHSTEYADVHLVPMFQDNYGFILIDKQTNTTACIDPGDGSIIKSALDELKLKLNYIFCTHKHYDHVGGILELKQAFPTVSVIGTKYEEVPGLDRGVGEGDIFQFGSLFVKVS